MKYRYDNHKANFLFFYFFIGIIIIFQNKKAFRYANYHSFNHLALAGKSAYKVVAFCSAEKRLSHLSREGANFKLGNNKPISGRERVNDKSDMLSESGNKILSLCRC